MLHKAVRLKHSFAMVLSAVVLSVLLWGCTMPEILVEEREYFEQVAGDAAIEELQLTQPGFTLKYARSGVETGPALIYIHGTPGGWNNAMRYLMDKDLQKVANLVSIDRPGWGHSMADNNQPVFSFAEQARLIKPLLEQLAAQNQGAGIVLVGHSLGASIAPYIAMEYPQLVTGLILLAGSLDPQLGKPRWYNKAASMGMVSWFLGADMRRANDEIMILHSQLESMSERWAQLAIPVTVIQGLQDELVFPENADYAERVMINADLTVIRINEGGHFIPWENRQRVTREIYQLFDNITASR